MTQRASLSSSCSVFFESSCSSKNCYILYTALGIIFLLGGIFCLLAAYKILPGTVNVMSDLRGIIFGSVILTGGALAIVYGLWKSKEKSEALQPAREPIGPATITASNSRVSKFSHEEWEIQIQKAQVHDVKTGPQSNSWKRRHPEECQQSFICFDKSEGKEANKNRNTLYVIAMDKKFSDVEDLMLRLVFTYVALVHGMHAKLFHGDLLCPIEKRDNQYGDQYKVEWNLGVCTLHRPENGFVLGFTSQDLYGGPLDFCFGVGVWQEACGLFSICRLKGWTFEKTLKRLMILATHEFGHLRGMNHCINFSCNMEGTNSVPELDRTSLLYCAEDMAKICHLNGWSLKEGYERHKSTLIECQKFCQTMNYSVDFSNEIANLESKIMAL